MIAILDRLKTALAGRYAIEETSGAVVPGALKRGLGRAGKPARLILKDYFHIMSFRTRPEGAEPGL